jgi:hypothetical protein
MALLPIDPDACPQCGSGALKWTVHQPALLRHGGYGGTRRTVEVVCGECGWSLTREVSEVAP